jgi:hypothetical protein
VFERALLSAICASEAADEVYCGVFRSVPGRVMQCGSALSLVTDVGSASAINAGSAATAWFGGARPCRVMA